jgi:hypothetical protein
MSIITACSSKSSPREAAQEIGAQLQRHAPKLVIFFAAPKYDSQAISAAMQEFCGSGLTIGCSTAGEIVGGKMLKQSVVAMGIGSDIIEDAAVEIVPSIKADNRIAAAFAAIERHFGASMAELDFEKYAGLILVDGLQSAEEKLMMTIGDLTNISFIGGSAGDDLAFKKTFVYAGGKSYTDAAVLAVLKLKKGFDIIKTQSFLAMNKTLTATKVDEADRIVLEFDGRPAVEAYAAALGINAAEVADNFMKHPLGLLTGAGEPYVRSPQQVKGSALAFFCAIKEGMELSVLESTDIIADTQKAITGVLSSSGSAVGMINFNCILRTLELEQKNQTEAYGKIFSPIPTVGFSTYGEEYIGHINQTATILVFK